MLARKALPLIALAFSAAIAAPSIAAEGSSTVKVALLDMSAMFAGRSGSGAPNRSYGPGFGMMGPGYRGGAMGGGYGGMVGGGMMGRMSVHTNVSTVKAGKVTFDVSNLSSGMVHEMIVVAVDGENAALPYDYNAEQIPEKQVKMIGETEEMPPNSEKEISLELKPGTYLLICNVPGHYASGMWTSLSVTE